MESRTPPRYVPTLTKVVEAGNNSSTESPSPQASAAPSVHIPAPTPAASPNAQQPGNLTQRVMRRVDITLERHLREATTQVALEFSRSMAEHMRPAIEQAVQKAVKEALEAERSR